MMQSPEDVPSDRRPMGAGVRNKRSSLSRGTRGLRTAFLLAWTTAASGSLAQTQPHDAVLVKAGRLLDVRTGNYRADVAIWIEHGLVRAIGPQAEVTGKIPTGTKIVDLSGMTVLPGLIDCHTHLLSRTPEGPTGYLVQLATKSQATRALEGAANARATLRAGFTTVRDVGNEGSDYADVALRDAIRDGLVEGPRMLVATRAIGSVGQYLPFGASPDLRDFPTGLQTVSGVEEARRAAREQIGHGADLIKVYADWRRPTLTPDELRVVVEEAHRQHVKVAAHATTEEGTRNAVDAGVDSIEHGFHLTASTIAKMRTGGVFLVPTVAAFDSVVATSPPGSVGRSRIKEVQDGARRSLRAARAAGVPIAVGSDASGLGQHGHDADELVALVREGLSPLEAIKAATIDAARLLGLEDQIGTLEPRRYGDLVAVAGDPLADVTILTHVRYVMKAGVPASSEPGAATIEGG